ncbi:MAG TPA: T9SS type A sorting domain-containing protein [Flavobacteriales bacterium]|nr:T9SS type A sorting domain-containing protein [Flavobacteriales bacterium]
MKKCGLLLYTVIAAVKLFAQPGQITNGGFENWQLIAIYEYPLNWAINSNTMDFISSALTQKSTDAAHLSYSVRLKNAIVEGKKQCGYIHFGYGCVETNEYAGFPYAGEFDQFTGQYKCNMVGNDSAFIILFKTYNGVSYPLTVHKIGGVTSAWTPLNLAVPAGPSDSLFFAVYSSNPWNTVNHDPGSWFMIDKIALVNTLGPAPPVFTDPSFESWGPQEMLVPAGWKTLNERRRYSAAPFVSVDFLDPHGGGKSVTIQKSYWECDGSDSIPGLITSGKLDMTQADYFVPYGYTHIPEWFSGWYKYDNGSGTDSSAIIMNDTAYVTVKFFAGGTEVGGYTKMITAGTGVWTHMAGVLNITTIPDSAIVWATAGNKQYSILKLDDLAFYGGTLGMSGNTAASTGFFVYPNPAFNQLNVEGDMSYTARVELDILDMAGKKVHTSVLFENAAQQTASVNIEKLPAGMFTYCLTGQGLYVTGKFVKQ